MQPRFVVLDWGFIRSLGRSTVIPGDWQFLLPDIILHEIVDIEPRDDAHKFWGKFMAFIDAHRSRIWGADYWAFVAKKFEKDFKRRAKLANIIDRGRTRAFRKSHAADDAKVIQHLQNFHQTSHYAAYKEEQRDFVEFCNKCVVFIKEKPPHSDNESQRKWIQNPDLVAQLITGPGKLRTTFRRMQVRHATGFPDRWAVARWTRISVWYALQRWRQGNNPSAGFENNFDDAQYLFLASYAGHIATRDGGLKKAVEVLFPGCCITDFGIG